MVIDHPYVRKKFEKFDYFWWMGLWVLIAFWSGAGFIYEKDIPSLVVFVISICLISFNLWRYGKFRAELKVLEKDYKEQRAKELSKKHDSYKI